MYLTLAWQQLASIVISQTTESTLFDKVAGQNAVGSCPNIIIVAIGFKVVTT